MIRSCALIRDRRGAAIIEFAIIAPVMVLLMMGISDLLFQLYVNSILNGTVQKSGRAATIQGAASQTATIDGQVVQQLQGLLGPMTQSCNSSAVGGPVWCSVHKSYANFSSNAPEPFTDGNGNGKRDAGECFTDINNNGQWDAEPGNVGLGGADDVQSYSMTISYRRLFPLAGLLGWPDRVTSTSQTLLKNQPYASQLTAPTPTVCT
ncbi:MAG: TadE/TadG family type IV pilus assembly protein [Sphingomonas sp.]|jgi:Flp pilus assembly protein TadG